MNISDTDEITIGTLRSIKQWGSRNFDSYGVDKLCGDAANKLESYRKFVDEVANAPEIPHIWRALARNVLDNLK